MLLFRLPKSRLQSAAPNRHNHKLEAKQDNRDLETTFETVTDNCFWLQSSFLNFSKILLWLLLENSSFSWNCFLRTNPEFPGEAMHLILASKCKPKRVVGTETNFEWNQFAYLNRDFVVGFGRVWLNTEGSGHGRCVDCADQSEQTLSRIGQLQPVDHRSGVGKIVHRNLAHLGESVPKEAKLISWNKF